MPLPSPLLLPDPAILPGIDLETVPYSPPPGGLGFEEPVADHSWILCAADGTQLIEVTRQVGTRGLSFKRNGVAEAKLVLSHESAEAQAVVDALSDGIPLLQVFRRRVPDQPAVRRFCGYLAPFQEEAEEQSTMTLVFRDPMGKVLGDGENRGTFLDVDLRFDAIDAGEIAATLIAEANAQGFTGLAPTGTIEPTQLRDRAYENHAKIGDLIVALTQVIGGFDYEVKPILEPAIVFLDRFDTNTLPDYAFDIGGGTIAVSSGKLAPSDLTEKRLYRAAEPQRFADVQLTVSWTPSSSLLGATSSVGIIGRRLSQTSYTLAQVSTASNNLDIFLFTQNAPTSPVASVDLPALVLGATYWLRYILTGDVLTAEHWTSPPPPFGGTPAARNTVRLTGPLGDIFGSGTFGGIGIQMTPASLNWRMDDFEVRSFGPTIGEFNVYASIGKFVTTTTGGVSVGAPDAMFGYGEDTVNNVTSVERETSPPINAVRLIGQSGGTDANGVALPSLVAVAEDLDSQARYGVWWSQQSFPDIIEQSTLDARAEATLRPEPVRVVGFTPDPRRAPKPWDDFWLGDTVPLSIRRGAFEMDVTIRINGIDITIDENGTESYSLTVEQGALS